MNIETKISDTIGPKLDLIFDHFHTEKDIFFFFYLYIYLSNSDYFIFRNLKIKDCQYVSIDSLAYYIPLENLFRLIQEVKQILPHITPNHKIDIINSARETLELIIDHVENCDCKECRFETKHFLKNGLS
jgi:hypothetical protein